MRVALVSPYSWTYPGGVARHIEALAGELLAAGHDVSVLTPYDHDDRRTAWMHRGARPQRRAGPGVAGPARADDRLAVERRRLQPRATRRRRSRPAAARAARGAVRRRARPRAGHARRRAGTSLTSTDAPLVGTFHCYSESRPPHAVAALHGRAPQAQPPRRPDRRLRGRGLDRPALLRRRVPDRARTASALPDGGVPAPRLRAPGEPLEIVFVGQAVERKGLPCCCAPSRRCASTCPARLTIVGASRAGGRAAAGRPRPA